MLTRRAQASEAVPRRERIRLRNEIGFALLVKVLALALLFYAFFGAASTPRVDPDAVLRHLAPAAASQ